MKRLFVILVLGLFITGCSDDDKGGEGTKRLSFSAYGAALDGTYPVNVEVIKGFVSPSDNEMLYLEYEATGYSEDGNIPIIVFFTSNTDEIYLVNGSFSGEIGDIKVDAEFSKDTYRAPEFVDYPWRETVVGYFKSAGDFSFHVTCTSLETREVKEYIVTPRK